LEESNEPVRKAGQSVIGFHGFPQRSGESRAEFGIIEQSGEFGGQRPGIVPLNI
jgi:hypothetical protein